MNEPIEPQRVDVDTVDRCSQRNCSAAAALIVYWPGRDPAPRMCVEHAQQALDVGKAMGVAVSVGLIG